MLLLVLGVLALLAVASWVTALVSALQILALAPKGQGFAVWYDIGFWRFARIAQVTGLKSEPYASRYQRAFLTFFASIILIAVAALLFAAERQN